MAESCAAAAGLLMIGAICLVALDALDRAFPPPLEVHAERSVEVVDRDGNLLRVYAVGDGRWRLAADPAEVDPAFLDMLIAYEDRRFRSHVGVDPLALLRASGNSSPAGGSYRAAPPSPCSLPG